MAKRPARRLIAEDIANPHPVYCVWELTLACDLRCKHCGSRAGDARVDELTTEECLDVVEQLSEVGVREVSLIGGEAYLRDDWTIIARALDEVGILVSLNTGARNLSDERIQAAIDSGIRAVTISLDGLQDTHDSQRGKGSWAAAVGAAKRVQATKKLQLNFTSQINRLTMPELPALADLFAELKVYGWQIQLTTAMGRAADRPDLLLQPYELLELFPLLVWLKQTKLDPANVRLAPSNNVGYFSPYETMLRWRGELGVHWNGCVAGKWSIGLEADGKIKGCPSLPSAPYTGGNLKTERLADVIENAPELTHLNDRTSDDLWGWCKTCYYAENCKGGCTWTSHTLFGRPGNNPYCIHRALTLEKEGMRERVAKLENAPGDPFDFGKFELIKEPIPEGDDVPSIVGIALQQVTEATSNQKSLWPAEIRRQTMKRS